MNQETLLTAKVADLPTLFPGHSLDELMKLRKRAQNARWQKKYRADGRDKNNRNSWLGYLDGPPIARCHEEEKMVEDAINGSSRLAAAIKQAGLSA